MIRAQYTEVLKNLMDDPIMSAELKKAMSSYPIYQTESKDPDVIALIPTRDELNKKILNAYKYREIGFETPARFFDELEISLCEIMPYYNQRLKTVEIMGEIEDPFGNVDVTESYEETRKSETEGNIKNTTTAESESSATSDGTMKTNGTDETSTNGTSKDTQKNVHSATPQGQLDITASGINGIKYADDVNWDEKDNTNTSKSNGKHSSSSESKNTSESTSKNDAVSDSESTGSTDETIKHTLNRKGNQGVNTYAHDMIELRTTILNVEQEIINDDRISELFMRVF